MVTNNSCNFPSSTNIANVLMSGGGAASSFWSTATYPTSTTINQILYSNSTDHITGLATANQGVLTTGTTGIPVITAIATNGQLIIGSTAGAPAAATITAGANIGVTNGSNSITLAVTATLPLAVGGTNATSFSTSTGIVKYDGTRLVTSTTALIDSSNRQTNSSQPAFFAYQASNANNATGDGTAYTLGSTVDLTEVYDQNSNFDPATGTFTAPVTGKYYFSMNVDIGTGVATGMLMSMVVAGTSAATYYGPLMSPVAVASSGTLIVSFGSLVNMTATDTITFVISLSGTTKTAGILGQAAGSGYLTYVSGALIC